MFKQYIFGLPILLLFLSLAYCKRTSVSEIEIPSYELTLIKEITLPFKEPSGIAWSDMMQTSWVVSGDDQHIYQLDSNAVVIKKLNFIGTDLEGIAFDEKDSTLWVVDEAEKKVFHLNLSGDVLMEKELSYLAEKNKGPEGITIGPDGLLYIVNERSPSVLLKLDSNYNIMNSVELDFALDYSDISYDKKNDVFYIISDESKAFYFWTLQKGVVCKFLLNQIGNEGIAYDYTRGVFYIVNDKNAKFYSYKLK